MKNDNLPAVVWFFSKFDIVIVLKNALKLSNIEGISVIFIKKSTWLSYIHTLSQLNRYDGVLTVIRPNKPYSPDYAFLNSIISVLLSMNVTNHQCHQFSTASRDARETFG